MSHFHFCVEFPFKVSRSNNCNLMQIQKNYNVADTKQWQHFGFCFLYFLFAHSVYRKIFTAVLCCLIYELFFSLICRLIWFLSMCGVMIPGSEFLPEEHAGLTRPYSHTVPLSHLAEWPNARNQPNPAWLPQVRLWECVPCCLFVVRASVCVCVSSWAVASVIFVVVQLVHWLSCIVTKVIIDNCDSTSKCTLGFPASLYLFPP